MALISFKRRTAAICFLSLLAVSSGWPTASAEYQKSGDESARLFAYDKSAAFELKVESEREQDGITIQDVSYAAYEARRGRVKAYLVTPKGTGPFACILFFHWLGASKSNRDEFLDEAVALAQLGTVSLLIQGFFPWTEKPTDGQADRRRVIDQTIEVRRALDLLLSRADVDRKRVGFVGHDYGAMYGSIVAGLEKRIKAFVLMAGMGSFSDWSLKYWPATGAQGADAYRQAINEVDPILHVRRASPAALLFQFANNDKYIPKTAASEFFGRASKPKEVKWYDAIHDLNVEAARNDRRAWLKRQLKLSKPK